MHSLQNKEWGEKRMCEKILQTLQSVKEEKEQASLSEHTRADIHPATTGGPHARADG